MIGILGLASSLVAACSTGGDAAGPAATRAVPVTSAAAVERPACAADAGGELVTATTSTGDPVGILVIGAGTGGVVLGPHDDGDICQWLPYATRLAARYRVALYDWADPRTDLPALAAAALRDAGAQKVVLGGASYGGAVALSEAYRVQPAPSGVLTLGGEITLPGLDGTAGIAQWTGPLLQLGSTDDDFFDSDDAEQLRLLHPGDETIVMFPGTAHGLELLRGHDRDAAWDAIDQFLAGVLG
ncbi:hypothetical protein Cch01nite_27980 [Cellulomonas chitinilytica]|uniref:Alpha/beta hydrolase n=1 Tax=Cellulomonas chitinilytica TaxID=398759 RepID=A0A919U3E8_9CELL|nr:hypothetical protein [Cellulomonas chitinilytica]GIG22074.1 hypothetical protein Cch01nite_27980 [Cellulomonas chitinilytica]